MNRQETREGLDVYRETTTFVCSEVRRSRGGSVTGIVTSLDCHAPHLQFVKECDSERVFSSRRGFIRHTNCVLFAIIVTHLIARAVPSRYQKVDCDDLRSIRKRRMAQILLRSYH